MSSRRPNPVAKRAEWIAKKYPRTVLTDSLLAWLEANGVHQPILYSLQWDALTEAKGPRPPNAIAVLGYLQDQLKRRPQLETTPFDRYLPWLARALNKQHKYAVKRIRDFGRLLVRRAEKGHPEGAAASQLERQTGEQLAKVRDVGEAVELLGSPRGYFASLLGHEARFELGSIINGDYKRVVDDAIRHFGVISRWATDENFDLGSLSVGAAADIGLHWADKQRWKGGTPPGHTIFAWPDGWTIRELISEDDLEYEGAMMGHCVDAYRPQDVGPGPDSKFRLFSLRDPQNQPHATMEWDRTHQYTSQLRGKGNAAPLPKYVARVLAFRLGMLPIYRPTAIEAPPDDPRHLSKHFQGRYFTTLPWARDVTFEMWDGLPYDADDVDEDILDSASRLFDIMGQHAAVEQIMHEDYSPANAQRLQAVDIKQRFEMYFLVKGHRPYATGDELVESVVDYGAVHDEKLEPMPGGTQTVSNWLPG